eukprot:TRINITY_DN4430_c0_g1_i1.p1 TRINITY_DN4430_c0_g1~~TRINITY_DN4430_c0_g1_i1.p1  ORF type:complete len:223 (-),score=1.44 TRINITY_DN4430_c0_g1_i1:37-705(-)
MASLNSLAYRLFSRPALGNAIKSVYAYDPSATGENVGSLEAFESAMEMFYGVVRHFLFLSFSCHSFPLDFSFISTPTHNNSYIFILDETSVFEDPLVRVSGKANIRSQFYILRQACSSIRIVKSSFDYDNDTKVASFDAVVEYHFDKRGYLVLKLHHLVKWHLNQTGRVDYHEDSWSLLDLLKSLPVVNHLFLLARQSVGWMTSLAFRLIQPQPPVYAKKLN